MSIFTHANTDPPTGTAPAGPRLGFFGAMEAAYDSQVRGWSQFGLQAAYSDIDFEQRELIRQRVGEVPAALRFGLRSFQTYDGFARYFEGGGPPEVADQIAAWDGEIEKLRSRIPELRTYRELWEEVKARAGGAEAKWEGGTTTWPGMVGGFLGGAAASVQPRTDPLNALSLGIAPGGRTAVQRLSTASGGNAAIEAINQATGVQANRRLLGLEHSAGQAIQQVLFAGAVGFGFQGGAELLSAGLRRLRAPDIAKEPGTGFTLVGDPYYPGPTPGRPPLVSDRAAFARSYGDLQDLHIRNLWPDAEAFMAEVRAPWAESRLGRSRQDAELGVIAAHMQRWDADDLATTTATALHKPPTRIELDPPWWIRDQDEVAEELARHYDPELYTRLDDIDRQIAALRTRAGTLRGVQTTPRAREVEAELEKVQELQRQIEELSRRAGDKRYRQRQAQFEIDKLNGLQRRILERIRTDAERLSGAQLEMVEVSRSLTLLEKMRQTLQPMRQHAISVAKGEMSLHMAPVEALIMFDRLNAYGIDLKPPIPKVAGGTSPNTSLSTLDASLTRHDASGDVPPATRDASPKPGEASAETVVRVTKESADASDDGTVLAQRIREALSEEQRKDVQLGDTATMDGKPVTVVDMLDKDGVRLAKVRQQDGTVIEVAPDKLERVPTVDLGRGPMRLDQEIIVGLTEDGAPRSITVRQLLKEIDDDEAMLTAMTTCAR